MSTWDYRVAKVHPKPFEPDVDGCSCQPDDFFVLIEQYYDDEGEPYGWGRATPYGDTLEELRADLELMLRALDRPVVEVAGEEWGK